MSNGRREFLRKAAALIAAPAIGYVKAADPETPRLYIAEVQMYDSYILASKPYVVISRDGGSTWAAA